MHCLRKGLAFLPLLLVALSMPACRQTAKSLTSQTAAELAAQLANTEAGRRFDRRPFIASAGRAVFEVKTAGKDRWYWTARVGFGSGDVAALVSFARDGTQPFVIVLPMDFVPPKGFLVQPLPTQFSPSASGF
ncbi:MAG: hypothetical protein WDN28_16300 [Chthoniobacter sp.]